MREPSRTAERPTREKQAERVVDRVEKRVEKVVKLRTGGMIRGLRVEVGEGRVTLTGRTSSFYNKQLATHAALGALGDQTLSNLIQVN